MSSTNDRHRLHNNECSLTLNAALMMMETRLICSAFSFRCDDLHFKSSPSWSWNHYEFFQTRNNGELRQKLTFKRVRAFSLSLVDFFFHQQNVFYRFFMQIELEFDFVFQSRDLDFLFEKPARDETHLAKKRNVTDDSLPPHFLLFFVFVFRRSSRNV